VVAGQDSHHRRRCHLLRCLRRAGDRIGTAGHRSAVEAYAAADRIPDLGRLPRTIGGGAAVRLDRRALRADDRDGLVDRAVRAHEPRLRTGVGLQLVPRVPHHPGHRARRGSAGRGGVHQRARQGTRPRPLRAALRVGVPHRPGGGRLARIVDRAPSRLAMDVRRRRAAGAARAGAAPPVAGIATLARGARPHGGSGSGGILDRGRDAEGDRPSTAAAQAGGLRRGQARILGRPVRPVLSAAYAGGVGDLVRGLFRELRTVDLAADRLPHRVQAPARRVAAVRIDHAGRRAHRHPDLRLDHRPCRPATVVRALVRGSGDCARRACILPHADRGAGAHLHDYRLFLCEHHQHRGLSLHARALPDARARSASAPPRRGCGSPP
jgi:hypothetical protein